MPSIRSTSPKPKRRITSRIDHGVPLYRCSSMAAFISMRRTSSDSASSQPSPDSENCSPSHGSAELSTISTRKTISTLRSMLSSRPASLPSVLRLISPSSGGGSCNGSVIRHSTHVKCDRRTVCPFVFCHHPQCRCHQFNVVHPGNGQCTDNLAGDNIAPQRGGT